MEFGRTVLLASFSFLFFSALVYGDDTAVSVAGGFPGSAQMQQSEQIEMKSENVKLTILDGKCITEASFELFNSGDSIDVDVAFPQWQWGTRESGEFLDFVAFVDGVQQTVTEVAPAETQEFGASIINKWFVRRTHFEKGATVHTSVRYTTTTEYGSIVYLFGTGSNWKGPIGKATFVIENLAQQWINAVSIPKYIAYEEIYNPNFNLSATKNLSVSAIGNTTTIVLSNLNPEPFDSLFLDIGTYPRSLIGLNIVNPIDGWFYSRYRIPAWILRFRTNEQLRVERNLIFAGHGNIFESEEINAWLKRYASDFYRPTKKVTLEELTQMEQQNVKTILIEEKMRSTL